MSEASLTPALAGFLVGGGLIIAIGAQNAYVLRQGLLKRHVFAVALFCAVSDALLILLGVGGLGTLVVASPILLKLATWGGAAFLIVYGLFAFRRALTPAAMQMADTGGSTLPAALAACAAFTFLNPHVYLDTVVLVGSLSATHGEAGRWVFGAGAATASFVWFFALAYGARLLGPIFARPAAWRVLDVLIGCVMWMIAATLLAKAL
ncbi:MAG: LysE/ArgO family amino acid transporter [Bosea sp. (in: a-proteobacteria)]